MGPCSWEKLAEHSGRAAREDSSSGEVLNWSPDIL